MAERANLYDNIIDPVTGYTHPVKSKKGARIVKNYMAIYKHTETPTDSQKLIISSPYYNNLLINQNHKLKRYKTFTNVKNSVGEDVNEAYPHVINYYNNLGEYVLSDKTVLKILVLCATNKTFDKKVAYNWLIHLHPIIMAEMISTNLPLEITYLTAPKQGLDEGIIFEKESGIDATPCDMDMIQSNCVKHNIIVGLVPYSLENERLREAGNPENLKIDVLGDNKYDIIIDENCPKIGDIGIDFRSLFHHMTYNSWLVLRDYNEDLRGFNLIEENLIEEIRELKRLDVTEDLMDIQYDITKLEKELQRLGIYNYVKQKYLIDSKIGHPDEFIGDRGYAKYMVEHLVKYKYNKEPYRYGRSSIFTVSVIKFKRSVFSETAVLGSAKIGAPRLFHDEAPVVEPESEVVPYTIDDMPDAVQGAFM